MTYGEEDKNICNMSSKQKKHRPLRLMVELHMDHFESQTKPNICQQYNGSVIDMPNG